MKGGKNGVNMHGCIYIHIYIIYMYMYNLYLPWVCAHVQRGWEQASGVFNRTWSSAIQLERLVTRFQGDACSYIPLLGLGTCASAPGLSCGCSRPKIRSLPPEPSPRPWETSREQCFHTMCTANFGSAQHKLESSVRREPWLRKCLYEIGL